MMAPLSPRLKRITMRAWRRGTKEMDLILGPYADTHLPAMDDRALDQLEALMDENDQDLYAWITGAAPSPAAHAALLSQIATFARARLGPNAAG